MVERGIAGNPRSERGAWNDEARPSTVAHPVYERLGMHRTALKSLLSIASFVVLATAACSSSTSEVASTEDAIKPASSYTPWELAVLCEDNIIRHQAVRQQELAGGIVRWQCGDLPGVDGEGDRGQEYCEYFALSNGKRVNRLADVDRSKPLTCFFTSVFADVDGRIGGVGDVDESLARGLRSGENADAWGGVVPDALDPALVRMKRLSNTRGAASALLKDTKAVTRRDDLRHTRTAACLVSALAAEERDALALEEACAGVDLGDDAAWSKAERLGARVVTEEGEALEEQRDLVACMAVKRLQHGGENWRMSDPHIVQIAYRAMDECSCEYAEVPRELEGFPQGTWSSEDQLPPGCRRAKIDGKEHPLLTICEVSEQEIGDIELNLEYAENLQAFCNERFGRDIVLTAPLRAIEKAGTCERSGGPFCAEFAKTAK